jgi:small-conductance mechanosensitive channel
MDSAIREQWLIALAVLLGSIVVGYLARVIFLRRVAALFARTETDIDDIFLKSVRGHVPVWFILAGLVIAAHVAPVQDRHIALAVRAAMVLFVLSLSMAAANFGTAMLTRQAARTGTAAATTSLTQNIVRISILGLGGLLVLSNLGISITPLLTALGVGSLAVALALQPTLANLFAGVHISVARMIRVGDFVALVSGAKGYVTDIGWRSTRLRELPNNIVIVPNARLAEMIVTNYAMPETEQSALVQVGVAYGSDLAAVERVTCEVAREVLATVQGGMPGFDPFIRYNAFGDSSINFSVILRVKEFTDRYLVTHEFIKRLKARYDAEGIEIPFPQRVVHLLGPPAEPSVARALHLAERGDQPA